MNVKKFINKFSFGGGIFSGRLKKNREKLINTSYIPKKQLSLFRELEQVYKTFVLPDMELTEDVQALELIFQLLGTGYAEAIFIRYYLGKCADIKGDVCEFGIAQGATSAMIANDIRKTDKNLWLFDSFEGLSVPTEKDILKDDIFHYGSMEKYAFSMKCSINEVIERLKGIDIDFNKVNIISGFIEETINDKELLHGLQQISFAYIDFDLYEPIRIALEFLNQRVAKGGTIIVDDYDFFSTGAKTAVDEFICTHKDYYSLEIPKECAGKFCIIQRIQ